MKTSRLLRLLSAFVLAAALGPAARAGADDLGPYPPEVSAWTDAVKEEQRAAARDLKALLATAAARGKKEIVVPPGDYRFNQTKEAHLSLEKLHDVVIDFQGSTLWFETEITGLALHDCRNVTLRNVFLDWDPLPFLQGKVVALHPESNAFDIRIDPGYERVAPGMSRSAGQQRLNFRGMVFADGQLKPRQKPFGLDFSWDRRNGDGSYRVKFQGFYDVRVGGAGIAVGDPMVILARMGRAVTLENCDDCVLEDVTLYSSPFVEFVQTQGSGTTFSRCHIARRPGTNRLLAGNADGINCSNMSRGPLIEDCTMETIGDDFVNIHGFYSRVLWQEDPTRLVCSRIARQREISGPVTVEFFDRVTMKRIGVRQATAEALSWKIEPGHCQADLSQKWHSGEASDLDYGKTVPAHRLTLDSPLQVPGDAIVACEAFSCPGTVVRGCDFRGSLARGIRLQSPGALVEGNHLAMMASNALTMVGQATFWGEGTYVHSTTVRGNTFEDSGLFDRAGDIRAALVVQEGDDRDPQRLPHDIRIEDNVFTRSGGAAIVARGVDRLTVSGNRISGYGNLPVIPKAGGGAKPANAIVLEGCDLAVLKDNQVSDPGPHASPEAVRVVGGPDPEADAAATAP